MKASHYGLFTCFVKSNFRAIERVLDSSMGEVNFRFSFTLLGAAALTAGPDPVMSTLPSTSSNGLGAIWVEHFGSFEG